MDWLLAATAPIGTAPFVSPLAMVIMSGMTPKPIGGERRAQPAEAGDHLVENQQYAVSGADFAQSLEIAERRRQHAGRAAIGSTITAAMRSAPCTAMIRISLRPVPPRT